MRGSANTLVTRIQSDLMYYTTYEHLMELIFVPYNPRKKRKQSITDPHKHLHMSKGQKPRPARPPPPPPGMYLDPN